tara:strand:- start:222 stop:485 length:264 start_codon:yes stop_codon:yes gene_type:complete
MYKLKLLSTAINSVGYSNANTTIFSATLVYAINTHQSTPYHVLLGDESNNDIGKIIIPANTSILIEKEPTQKIDADSPVYFTKVAYR